MGRDGDLENALISMLILPRRYTPSLAVGVLGVVLFVVGLIAHLYLLLRHRTWYFSTVVVGTIMEIVGYAFRILSSQQNPYSVPWFVVQVRSVRNTDAFFRR